MIILSIILPIWYVFMGCISYQAMGKSHIGVSPDWGTNRQAPGDGRRAWGASMIWPLTWLFLGINIGAKKIVDQIFIEHKRK